MSCRTYAEELISWQHQELSDLREENRRLREERDAARESAALARGGERFWRQVAEVSGPDPAAVAAVNRRMLERRTG